MLVAWLGFAAYQGVLQESLVRWIQAGSADFVGHEGGTVCRIFFRMGW